MLSKLIVGVSAKRHLIEILNNIGGLIAMKHGKMLIFNTLSLFQYNVCYWLVLTHEAFCKY